MDDGGAGIYRQFAREEARDRRRFLFGLGVAGLVHLALLVVPWSWGEGPPELGMPPLPGEAFRLTAFRFAPAQPAAVPAEAEEADPGPPVPARADILVPEGPPSGLVPPRPVRTPPPTTPEGLWQARLGAEVRLTVVVDPRGEVAETTVLEVLPLPAEGGGGEEEASGPAMQAGGEGGKDGAGERALVELTDEQRASFARVAEEAASEWRFAPATYDGNPISMGIGVRIVFPLPGAAPAADDEPATEAEGGADR